MWACRGLGVAWVEALCGVRGCGWAVAWSWFGVLCTRVCKRFPDYLQLRFPLGLAPEAWGHERVFSLMVIGAAMRMLMARGKMKQDDGYDRWR